MTGYEVIDTILRRMKDGGFSDAERHIIEEIVKERDEKARKLAVFERKVAETWRRFNFANEKSRERTFFANFCGTDEYGNPRKDGGNTNGNDGSHSDETVGVGENDVESDGYEDGYKREMKTVEEVREKFKTLFRHSDCRSESFLMDATRDKPFFDDADEARRKMLGALKPFACLNMNATANVEAELAKSMDDYFAAMFSKTFVKFIESGLLSDIIDRPY